MGGTTRVYLRAEEDVGLRALADRHGTSRNYLVRAGVRLAAGLPVPRWYRELVRVELDRVEGRPAA